MAQEECVAIDNEGGDGDDGTLNKDNEMVRFGFGNLNMSIGADTFLEGGFWLEDELYFFLKRINTPFREIIDMSFY